MAHTRPGSRAIKKKYGDERRTQIVDHSEDISIEDMIVDEDMAVTISHEGYIKRNPVTLYSGNCGPLCDSARALLNRRGVPYREIDPAQPAEAQKLKQASGDMQVPVLTIGVAQVLKGFEEDRWQGALDQAGYPKTPAVRITQLKRDTAEKAVSGAIRAGSNEEPAKGTSGDGKSADGKSDGKASDGKADAKAPAPSAAAAEPKK